jgi:hypothetical protein
VLFLFFSTWRVGEARTLQWRDYDRTEEAIRLRGEHSKNKHGRVLPVEGELATIIGRRWQVRRLDCPYVFHRDGTRIGDFRKAWDRACAAIGFEGRIVHDLRRSGVRHLIRAGVPPHTVMAMSGGFSPRVRLCGKYVGTGNETASTSIRKRPSETLMLAVAFGRFRMLSQSVAEMAFKRSRVRLPSAPLCHSRC